MSTHESVIEPAPTSDVVKSAAQPDAALAEMVNNIYQPAYVTIEPSNAEAPAQHDNKPKTEAIGYTYRREDGTVERASDADDAIARCPVLGALALKSPEQANVLLGLMATRQTESQAATNTGQEKPPPINKTATEQKPVLNAPRPIAGKSETSRNRLAIDHGRAAKSAALTSIYHAELGRRQAQPEAAPVVASKPTEQEYITSPVTKAVKRLQKITTIKRPDILRTTESKKMIKVRNEIKTAVASVKHHDAVNQRPQPQSDNLDTLRSIKLAEQASNYNKKSESAEDRPSGTEVIDAPVTRLTITVPVRIMHEFLETPSDRPVEFKAAMAVLPVAEPLTAEEETKFTKEYYAADVQVDREQLSAMANQAGTEITVVPKEHAADAPAGEQLQLYFDAETVETYLQLTKLIANDEYEAENIVLSQPLPGNVKETRVLTDFETFLKTQPVEDEPVTLEVMTEQEVEQPLAGVLVQLAQHVPETRKMPRRSDLFEIIYEIEAALPARTLEPETAGTAPQITPELTERLLKLLHLLGYEHPKEVLTSFVNQYGLDFLLQAMEYICQLNRQHNRVELLINATPAIASVENSYKQRFGKTILSIVESNVAGLVIYSTSGSTA